MVTPGRNGSERPRSSRRVGLVAPLPPQIGGVASVAGWLLAHANELGVEYDTFDLWRPATAQLGGRLQLDAIPRQARLGVGFARWLRRAPKVVHYCVACSTVSLARDLAFVAMARAAGKTVIAHVHGSEFATDPRRRFIHVPGVRVLARLTAERVALTPWAARELDRIGVSSRSIVNPLGIEPAGERPARAEGALRLLFVGTYGRAKGCHDLIEAIAVAASHGTEADLLLVGKEMYDGEEEELRALAARRGLADRVTFAGMKRPGELPAFYEAADVICLPSYREVLPMALLEGMSFGLPALASTVGGIPDVVQHGETGLLVERGDVAGLANGIRAFADDPDRRTRMGAAARDHIRSFADPQEITARWRTLYAEIG